MASGNWVKTRSDIAECPILSRGVNACLKVCSETYMRLFCADFVTLLSIASVKVV